MFHFDDLVKKLLAGGLSALLIKIGTAGFTYLGFVVLARVTTDTEYGLLTFAFTLATVLSIVADLGVSTSVLRFWPEYHVREQLSLAKGFLLTSSTLVLLTSSAIGIFLIVSSKFLESGGGNYRYLLGAGLLVPCLSLSEYLASALRARGNVVLALGPRDIVWRAGIPMLALLFYWLGYDLSAFFALALASGLLWIIVILQSWFTLKSYSQELASIPAHTDMPLWIKTSWPLGISAVLYVMAQQFDVIMVGLYLSPETTGAYFAAQKTASLLALMLIASNMISAPLISRFFHSGETGELQRLVSLISLGISIPTLIGFLFLVFAGHPLLRLFDPGYISAYPVLLILGAGFMFAALSGPTINMMEMSGNEKSMLKYISMAYLLTLVSQAILIPAIGVIGAAIPTTLGMMAWNIMVIRKLRRELGIDPSVFHFIYPAKRNHDSPVQRIATS